MMSDPEPTTKKDYFISAFLFIVAILFIIIGCMEGIK